MAKNLMDDYPAIGDLERKAKKRIPHFAWEYLEMGTGEDEARDRNIESLREVLFVPQLMKGLLSPSVETELFGVKYDSPIGIAPVGLSGLIWPAAEAALAATAASRRIPYMLSTVATDSPEVIGPAADGMGWFQLYPPRDPEIRADIIERVASSGFTTMVVTADVPAPSRRERQRKAQVRVPPKIGPRLLYQGAVRTSWAVNTLRHGIPRFKGLEKYIDRATMKETAGFVGANLGGTLSFDYLSEVRELWDGPLVVKGILDPDDAAKAVDHGADAIQVSNHGGRQLDGAPGAIDALVPVLDRVGPDVPVIFDSGVRTGLDVARAMALGASFVFCGRAFMFGLGALGPKGAPLAYEILKEGLVSVLAQTGCESIDQLASRLKQ